MGVADERSVPNFVQLLPNDQYLCEKSEVRKLISRFLSVNPFGCLPGFSFDLLAENPEICRTYEHAID